MPRKKDATRTRCPYCKDNTVADVKDSRPAQYKDMILVRRRRQCQTCNNKFSTFEVPVAYLSSAQIEIDALETMIDILRTMREDAIKEQEHERLRAIHA